MDRIAEGSYAARDRNGGKQEVHIVIRAPEPDPDCSYGTTFRTRIELTGIGRSTFILGEGALQSLCLGVSFVRARLEQAITDGWSFYHPKSHVRVDPIHELFAVTRSERNARAEASEEEQQSIANDSHRTATPRREGRIRRALPEDEDALFDIWLRSVERTHDFLDEEEIQSLASTVRERMLQTLEIWVFINDVGKPVGFSGLSNNSLDALFVAPDDFRQGVARQLVEHARSIKGPLTADVFEQNVPARRFYESLGFEIVGQTTTEDSGRPTLLHMRNRM